MSHVKRKQLDQLFMVDSVVSVAFGVFALGAPHGVIALMGEYNHDAHEVLRLYGCLRLACGWILWHVRKVDDGYFRRHVCEALFVCYVLQALAVLRGQFTDRHSYINWLAIVLMLTLSTAYGSFRFGQGGNMIKIYELPSTASSLA